jgi:hypothetical protein
VTRCAVACIAVLSLAACGGSKSPAPAASTGSAQIALGAAKPIAPGAGCPATGLWAACSIMYRLDRAGLAPSIDSSGSPDEKMLTGAPLMLKIGFTAKLELHLYADSAARIADEQRIDRTQYVTPEQQQTMRRERTLIENANMVGLLTSINGHQRDRVADALMAGPPQPPTPQQIAPSKSKP